MIIDILILLSSVSTELRGGQAHGRARRLVRNLFRLFLSIFDVHATRNLVIGLLFLRLLVPRFLDVLLSWHINDQFKVQSGANRATRWLTPLRAGGQQPAT